MRFFKKSSHKKSIERKPKQSPSFFKILILDFHRHLRLPPVFVEIYGSLLPETVKLKISPCEKTWKVKLQEMEDGHHYITHGWNKFVRDVGLELGEFLVFRMIAATVFRVSVYQKTGCKREFSGNQFPGDSDHEEIEMKCGKCTPNNNEYVVTDMDNRKRYRPEMGGMSFDAEGNPLYYEVTLKRHQMSRLSLRTKFVKAADLERQQHITLEYLPGHRHHVVFLDHRVGKNRRTDVAGGWTQFRKANGMVCGNTYSLEFIRSNNVIQVKEVTTDDY